jgi:hypothetical protein
MKNEVECQEESRGSGDPSVMGVVPVPACSFLTFQNGVSLAREETGHRQRSIG